MKYRGSFILKAISKARTAYIKEERYLRLSVWNEMVGRSKIFLVTFNFYYRMMNI
ncbi:MAG: hypothetical protein M0P77_04010 [Firmicutes bacterium]|nr:hypothetical protein [Bacillota bacterium]